METAANVNGRKPPKCRECGAEKYALFYGFHEDGSRKFLRWNCPTAECFKNWPYRVGKSGRAARRA